MVDMLSFSIGLALGFLDFYLLRKTVDKGLGQAGQGRSVAPFYRAGAFRHVFILLAGICLIRVASLAPVPLVGGMLASVALVLGGAVSGRFDRKDSTSHGI